MPSRPLMSDFHVWLFAFTLGTAGAFLGLLLAAFAYEVMK